MRYFKFALLVLLLIFLSALNKSAEAQRADSPQDTMLDASVKTVAQTFCKQVGDSWMPMARLDRMIVGTADETRIRIHEATHVRQILNYPFGCRAAMHQYKTDPAFRFETELEAYCSELQLPDHADETHSARINAVAEVLHKRNARNLSIKQLVSVVEKRCPEFRSPEKIRGFP